MLRKVSHASQSHFQSERARVTLYKGPAQSSNSSRDAKTTRKCWHKTISRLGNRTLGAAIFVQRFLLRHTLTIGTSPSPSRPTCVMQMATTEMIRKSFLYFDKLHQQLATMSKCNTRASQSPIKNTLLLSRQWTPRKV